MTNYRILKQADLPLEAVILLIAGMTLLITGVLLFPVSTGALAYYENGLYGLLLVMFAVQMIALGKTPFGDLRTSKLSLVVGVLIAAVPVLFVVAIYLSVRSAAKASSPTSTATGSGTRIPGLLWVWLSKP